VDYHHSSAAGAGAGAGGGAGAGAGASASTAANRRPTAPAVVMPRPPALIDLSALSPENGTPRRVLLVLVRVLVLPPLLLVRLWYYPAPMHSHTAEWAVGALEPTTAFSTASPARSHSLVPGLGISYWCVHLPREQAEMAKENKARAQRRW
jgi:hypothetical protein